MCPLVWWAVTGYGNTSYYAITGLSEGDAGQAGKGLGEQQERDGADADGDWENGPDGGSCQGL